jgi:hypothetical protein
MDLVDIVLWDPSHDIIGIIAVQHKQLYFVRQTAKLAVLLLLAAGPVWAAGITQPSKPDPLLDGGPTDPCAAGVDYADGVDANGRTVAPADVEARKVPLPDSIAVPLGRPQMQTSGRNQTGNPVRQGGTSANPVTLGGDSTYIAIDGRKLEPLVNPTPCAAVH